MEAAIPRFRVANVAPRPGPSIFILFLSKNKAQRFDQNSERGNKKN
jgi:hypothetical protein